MDRPHLLRTSSTLAWATVCIGAGLLCGGCGGDKKTTTSATDPFPLPPLTTTGAKVAQVGAVTLTVDELANRAAQQGPVIAQRMADPEKRAEFATQQIRFELLAQEAWSRGLSRDPAVLAELKKFMVSRLVNTELEKRTQTMQISEEELRQAYTQKSDEYNKPETARISLLVRFVKDAAGRKAAHTLVEGLKADVLKKEKANDPTAFAAAVKKDSQDEETKGSGGELPFQSRAELEQRLGPDVARAVFEQTQVGDMVVADAPNAVVLIKKTGLRHAVQKTLEQVKPQLRAKLLAEKRNQAFEALVVELRTKYAVKDELQLVRDVEFWGTRTSTPGKP